MGSLDADHFLNKAIALDPQAPDPSVGAVVARPTDRICYQLIDTTEEISTLRPYKGEDFPVRTSELIDVNRVRALALRLQAEARTFSNN